MVKILLKKDSGFKWYSKSNIYAKGYLFSPENTYYENENLVDYFQNIFTIDEFRTKLLNANGSFAVIIRHEQSILCASDRISSIPLFYTNDCNSEIVISDSVDVFSLNSLNNDDFYMFKSLAYTLENSTILDNVKVILPGQILLFDDNHGIVKTERYYSLNTHSNTHYLNYDKSFVNSINRVSLDVFKRLIRSVNGRQIALSLSGGYDSRYVASMLKLLGYENVVCFTYGSYSSYEVSISKKVADKLGYKWHFIPYEENKLDYYFSQEAMELYKYSFDGISIPHYQDMLALAELHKNEIIDKDAVIVTGFCGDFLGGSNMFDETNRSSIQKTELVNYIKNNHVKFYKDIESKGLDVVAYINTKLDSIDGPSSNDLPYYEYEDWFLRNRITKFVFNPLRNYEFYGHEWRMPLWDNDLVSLWFSSSIELRKSKYGYDRYLMNELFPKFDIAYSKYNLVRPRVKYFQFLPLPLYNALKNVYYKLFQSNVNINNYTSLIPKFEKELKEKVHKRNTMNENVYLTYIFTLWVTEKLINND